ncbi:MAG: hypothetical protein BWK80_26625 [Desulfobacteraceae bacterium IS3]|nr:MAG: hypothetical protein BWK80_26625 [Desulfobacteraceae bacterium IS3]
MKQKYMILKNNEKNELIIREFAELDKEVLSFLCEERYNGEVITAAMAQGRNAMFTALRTQNMYPPGLYMDKIIEVVKAMYDPEKSDTENPGADIFFNDMDYLTKDSREPEILEEIIDEEPEDIDELLDDDIEDDFDDKEAIDPFNSPLKIADDDVLDVEDDV